MNINLLIIAIMLLLICIVLIIKIYFMKKSINEIEEAFKYILRSNTNNIISITSEDRNIKKLTNSINKELTNLREQKMQYEDGNRGLQRLITDISHDLRTPLTAISCYTETLEEGKLNKKQKECVEIINNKTKELISLAEQLRDLSTGIDKERKIKKEKCCINNILGETIASYYNSFEMKNIAPNIDICKKKIYKNIDKDMIIRVFENLISNAIKYSDKNCEIKLKEDGRIYFINNASKLDVITVKKIFDRYYTIESIEKYSGLGLSIVKQLVELNGGKISAEYKNSCLIIEVLI